MELWYDWRFTPGKALRFINVVMPYYGYARQERKAQSREPPTAKLVATIITAGADRVLTLDLHAPEFKVSSISQWTT